MAFPYADFDVDLSSRGSCVDYVEASLAEWGVTLPLDAHLQLELTAGKDKDGVTVYRPYGYQAEALATAVNTKFLNEGSAGPVSGKFRDADKAIAAWLAKQAKTDAVFGLELPPGAVALEADVPYRVRFRWCGVHKESEVIVVISVFSSARREAM